MKSSLSVCLLLVASSLLIAHRSANASSLAQKLIVKRQSGEPEKESTTSSSSSVSASNGQQANQMQPARLYPDLPQQPPPPSMMGQPPFGQPQQFQPNFHGAPTPFVPFSPQLTPAQLSDLQRRMQPRPMSPSDRLQSQSFTNGLGRRLLSMIGLDQGGSANETSETGGAGAPMGQPRIDETMRALQNASVLQQLNSGVQSVYGSLSRMYNSTVQQQLNLLQERFRKEAENSTNPWQQRMTQQVPQFFKSMAAKVTEAQEGLNRIWQQMAQAGNGTLDRSANSAPQSSRSFMGSFDQFMNPNTDDPMSQTGNFFSQFGRSFGFGGPNDGSQGRPGAQADGLGNQLMSFWHQQVQPQIGMVRGQIARAWRDLTASGTLMPDFQQIRSRNFNGLSGAAPSAGGENSSSGIVDEILKEVDMNSPEYTIVANKSDDQSAAQPQPANPIGSQMQNRLITMQRELNQLWGGLTNSLQNAIGNVKNTLNPRPPQFAGPMAPASADNNKEPDPEENEIGGKVKDLIKLQRDADTVHDVVKQQQNQLSRPSLGDRFRSFVGNVDFGNEFNQLPSRFGDSMSRFGTAIGDIWNQIPRRWDNFMENMSPQADMARARLVAASPSSTTAAPSKPAAEAQAN